VNEEEIAESDTKNEESNIADDITVDMSLDKNKDTDGRTLVTIKWNKSLFFYIKDIFN